MGQISLQEEMRLAIIQMSGVTAEGLLSLHHTKKVTTGPWLISREREMGACKKRFTNTNVA